MMQLLHASRKQANNLDIKKLKVTVAAKKLKNINPLTKIKTYKSKLNKSNIENIIKKIKEKL